MKIRAKTMAKTTNPTAYDVSYLRAALRKIGILFDGVDVFVGIGDKCFVVYGPKAALKKKLPKTFRGFKVVFQKTTGPRPA